MQMIFSAFNSLVNGTVNHLIWGGGRAFYDGVSGKTSLNGIAGQWRDKAGNITQLNPAQKTARRIKANAKMFATGQKYSPHTGKSTGKKGSRAEAFGNMVGGTITSPITGSLIAAGWAANTAGGVALAASKPITRATGHLTYQGLNYAADTAIGAGKTILKMNKTAAGRDTLFMGAIGGTGVVALASSMNKDNILTSEKLAMYYGGSIDSVPGTLAQQGAAEGSRAMVDTGADGDLVLAMHTLR